MLMYRNYNRVVMIGKSKEIAYSLKEAAKRYKTVYEWLHHEYETFAFSKSLYYFQIRREKER
ncbi:hypothetical protein ACVIJU_002669 [Aeribacillus sp. SP014]